MPWNAARISARSRDWNQGRRIAAIRSRSSKRPDSVSRSTPVASLILAICCVRAGDVEQRLPLPAGEGDDHDVALVAVTKSWPKAAVEVVAVAARRVAGAELCLGDAAEMADDGERDVGERDLDQLALPGSRPMAVGRQQADGSELAHRDVPGGQHGVQRLGEVARAGRPREAGRRVDGVVDLAGAVAVALEVHHHQVLTARAQRVVGRASRGPGSWSGTRPAAAITAVTSSRPAVGAQVDAQRALALVQPGPEQRLPARAPAASGVWSRPPPRSSKRITSAPSWASVMPPSGAATNAEPSTTVRPSRIPVMASGPRAASRERRARSSPSPVAGVRTRRWTRPPSASGSQLGDLDRACAAGRPRTIGPRWSQDSHARIVARSGSARVDVRGGDADDVAAVDEPLAVGAGARVGVRVARLSESARELGRGGHGLRRLRRRTCRRRAARRTARPAASARSGSRSHPSGTSVAASTGLPDRREVVGVAAGPVRPRRKQRRAPEVEHRLAAAVDGSHAQRDDAAAARGARGGRRPRCVVRSVVPSGTGRAPRPR